MRRSLLLLFVFFGFQSCDDDYLDLQPKTEISSDLFYSEYDGALRGLSTLYARLADKDDGLIGKERFVSSSDIRNAIGEFREFSWSSSNRDISELWRKYYAFISQANEIISRITENKNEINSTLFLSTLESTYIKDNIGTNFNIEPANMLLAEARFLRAYAYFTLYRYFGGVPIVTEFESVFPEDIKRATRDEMFTFIEEDLLFSLENCLPNLFDGESVSNYGRITKGAAAGLLAKSYVFEASYIRRSEIFGNQISEDIGNRNKDDLYAKALEYCNALIDGSDYGSYELVDFYPTIFTKPNKEILFGMNADEGYGTGSDIAPNWGIDGDRRYGGSGGSCTSLLPILYELPTWEYNSRIADLYWDYGGIDNDIHQVSDNPNDSDKLIKLYDESGIFSLTGDLTRRTWNTIKAVITGNNDAKSGMWITEPIGKLMPDFFIEPGKGSGGYTSEELKVMNEIFASFELQKWMNNDETLLWNVKLWQFSKFRKKPPQLMGNSYDPEWSGVDYPILRLGEIFLLKAEALLFTGDVAGAIKSINDIRDRANYQSDLNDMFLNHGDASYSYIANAVTPIPENISFDVALKELLFERVRELVGEDDCRWLDVARFPDVVELDYKDISEYPDPLHHMKWYRDDRLYYRVNDVFNSTDVHRVLWPIPQTEFKFFPNMKQNPGY